jgi:predicted GNAT family acetyltransferase
MNHSKQRGLDRLIWTALTTRQAHLAEGDALARRYHPDVAPFAAVASDTPAAYQALHRLLQPHEQVALLCPEPLVPIDALRADRIGVIHQMVATRTPTPTRQEAAATDDHEVIRLTHLDASAMLELTQKAKPGPFGKRTHEMGNYIGIRERGRLIAMAGERMQVDGYVEISAVCVDDEWRGKGLAARLVNVLRGEIERRGETPFLHVLSENRAAAGLYERLGFEVQRKFFLTLLRQVEPVKA